MMSETLKDIENLETIVNLLEDGASDEKRSAMYMIKNMIAEKKSQVKLKNLANNEIQLLIGP